MNDKEYVKYFKKEIDNFYNQEIEDDLVSTL